MRISLFLLYATKSRGVHREVEAGGSQIRITLTGSLEQ